jgi:hypothetical protein
MESQTGGFGKGVYEGTKEKVLLEKRLNREAI